MAEEGMDSPGRSQDFSDGVEEAPSVEEHDDDEYVEELEEDLAAMREVLEENGLLLRTRLPEPTLGRVLVIDGEEETLAHQIGIQAKSPLPHDVTDSMLKDIDRLANRPDARLRALHLTVDCAERVWIMYLSHKHCSDYMHDDGPDSVIKLETAFDNLLAEQIAVKSEKPSDGAWESELLQLLKWVELSLGEAWGRPNPYQPHFPPRSDHFLPNAIALLSARHTRRVAKVFAMVAVGHIFPIEVIELIVEQMLREDGA